VIDEQRKSSKTKRKCTRAHTPEEKETLSKYHHPIISVKTRYELPML